MTDRNFAGVFPILQMPFNEAGQIIFEDLRAEVEYAIRGGVHGVGIAYGSEVNKLDDHERDEVLSAVVDQANGRIKVVMNTGAPSTVQTIHYTRAAKVLGADAVMIAPRQSLESRHRWCGSISSMWLAAPKSRSTCKT
jgi:4-hydroxy-tetrahydrodipicolinate synthase